MPSVPSVCESSHSLSFCAVIVVLDTQNEVVNVKQNLFRNISETEIRKIKYNSDASAFEVNFDSSIHPNENVNRVAAAINIIRTAARRDNRL